MNVQSKYPSTPEEFLRWNEGREGKREFVNGKVVEMMINVTRNHALLSTRLLVALSKRLDPAIYDVGSADFGVKTPDGVRYPDIFVDQRTSQSNGDDLVTTSPVFLAEVLSASSYSRDFGEKVTDYTSISSLQYYLVLAQDERRGWLWSRLAQGWSGPEQIAEETEINLPSLRVSLPLSELYAQLQLTSQ